MGCKNVKEMFKKTTDFVIPKSNIEFQIGAGSNTEKVRCKREKNGQWLCEDNNKFYRYKDTPNCEVLTERLSKARDGCRKGRVKRDFSRLTKAGEVGLRIILISGALAI